MKEEQFGKTEGSVSIFLFSFLFIGLYHLKLQKCMCISVNYSIIKPFHLIIFLFSNLKVYISYVAIYFDIGTLYLNKIGIQQRETQNVVFWKLSLAWGI